MGQASSLSIMDDRQSRVPVGLRSARNDSILPPVSEYPLYWPEFFLTLPPFQGL